MSRPHLVFVHVGKCAGSSISSALFRGGERFTELHGLNKFPHMRELVKNPSLFFLISVRDPVSRVLSSFYWDLWEKREKKGIEGPNGLWREIFDTFETANDLAEALSSTEEARRILAAKARLEVPIKRSGGQLFQAPSLGMRRPESVAGR